MRPSQKCALAMTALLISNACTPHRAACQLPEPPATVMQPVEDVSMIDRMLLLITPSSTTPH